MKEKGILRFQGKAILLEQMQSNHFLLEVITSSLEHVTPHIISLLK